jgi:aminoglycoside phosphotransferase (APT) family kinase protein
VTRADPGTLEPNAELDIERPHELVRYLRAVGRIGEHEEPRVRVLQGGVSNRTVLVERETGSWVVKQALPKLRVAVDWFADPGRIHREAEALRWLERNTTEGAVPRFVFEDRARHVLCMEAVPQGYENWKEKLLAGRVERGDLERFGRLLGRIHRQSAAQVEELRPAFGDRAFFEALRLEPYYLYTAERVPPAARFLSALVEETRSVASALVHGDFSPKNVLVREEKIVLLDHEVAHVGEPAFDLGFSLAHLLSKAHRLVELREELLGAALVYRDAYATEAGGLEPTLEERAVRHTLACLLARVRGRSQLEYLSELEKDRQEAAVLRLLPGRRAIGELVADFEAALR